MEFIEIDPLNPLPLGEVLATDGNGLYLLGELHRVNLGNIICIGNKEELPRVTHYLIPEKPIKKVLLPPREQPYNQIVANLSLLKSHGLIKSTGRKRFMIIGDIPADMKCSRKKATEEPQLSTTDERTENNSPDLSEQATEEGHG
jgi:hypothetical protein